MDFSLNFQPREIVCLEYKDTGLYAEVIQVIESRQMCWVRPLLLFGPPLYDLRQSSDLVCPLSLFRPALDTEVIPLLAELVASETPSECNSTARMQLHQFIQQVWQGRRSAFQTS